MRAEEQTGRHFAGKEKIPLKKWVVSAQSVQIRLQKAVYFLQRCQNILQDQGLHAVRVSAQIDPL